MNVEPRKEIHPRPLLQRPMWESLDGTWDFALDEVAAWQAPDDVQWNSTIEVPFAPECQASGVGNTGFFQACWYRRNVEVPQFASNQRMIVHFGAIDYRATVWVNGNLAATHEGGYTPVRADITRLVTPGEIAEVVVRAEDDPKDLAKPRGKQEWQLEPHSIWYPRTTGIWQPVWYEVIHQTAIATLQWTPNVERWEIGFEARVEGPELAGLSIRLRLSARGVEIVRDEYNVASREVHRRIALSDPGIDDYRNELLWSPSTPTLIQADIELVASNGEVLDRVQSYTALRSIAIQADRFVLNGRPTQLVMVLDQGYWPESGMTAPNVHALRRDVELAKAMGFNGVRKHQKVEDPRYLYWADVLGLMVWEEMPSAYRFTRDSIRRLTQQWEAVIERDRSHPCIVAWVPFNESWGVPDLPDSPSQRHFVQALYHLTRTLDPTRPVIGNDGWESVATDIIGIHDYDDNPNRLAARYASGGPRLFERERPGGRLLLIGQSHGGQPIMLTEFGGIAFSDDLARSWGYTRSDTADDLAAHFQELLEAVRGCAIFAGFCYTQFADTYQEANGLLYADRRPKFPLERVALATRGPRTARNWREDSQYRERLMAMLMHAYASPSEEHSTRPEARP
ncbi:hydrolase [Bryobacterales bacterium F-183]|nr:hydrolase [Bryobacterales bacterium F-183]